MLSLVILQRIKKDIKFNNKQSAEFLPKIYQNEDADAVIINSNFAIEQKLNPKKILLL